MYTRDSKYASLSAHEITMMTTTPSKAPSPADRDLSSSQAAESSADDVVVRISGFELTDTLDRLGGDVALYHSILELVIPTLTEALERLDASHMLHDNAALKAEVHAIRGMAANVGAVDLAASAATIETMLRDGIVIDAQVTVFRSLVTATIDAVEKGLRP